VSELESFHPAVACWFAGAFAAPTPAQAAAWPHIRAGRHTLVAAPTGSGKTLTAFLAVLDGLVRQGLRPEGLPDETVVVYVSPLKALSNDIRINLEAPLAGIRAELAALGLSDVDIRTAVRTGDTPGHERQKALRKPPHILVTTPESLYVLLGSPRSRAMLATVRAVIVDEIHAVAATKRGSHLALSLERLEALTAEHASSLGTPHRLSRIGLSATQKPIDEIARFLVGAGAMKDGVADCAIVDVGHARERDLALEVPPTPLSAVLSGDQWEQLVGRIAELALQHRTTLVFVNTRRMAERAARHLAERLGKEAVAAHHGSLAKETRLAAEQRLKRGELRLLVATASLELGIDIGDVDLVCQLGSPRSIAAFLQRAGRAGHSVGGIAKARLFAQTRDELVECAALLDCVRRGELDALSVLRAPLDVLAQQIVAETACRECDEDELFALVRRAWPYAGLERASFDAVVRMLADGFASRTGRRAHVHRDAVHKKLREKRGARMTALTSGGTIPETGDYAVLLEPQATTIGTVNEDFAVESLRGDVFQLGNTSYRILKIEPGRVRVEDAEGAAPNIPFWLGEAPGRSDELSRGVSRLRDAVAARIAEGGAAAARAWLADEVGIGDDAAAQLVEHLGRALAALGTLPTAERIVLERFFDESGGMQLVVHSPLGSRLNRAWGLALRKRFCRRFNFELQAAATEDAIVLSLSTSHSFPLDEVARYLHSATCARGPRPGGARSAALWRALALERDDGARAAAFQRRPQGRAAAAAHALRGSARRRLSRPGRVRRERRRRSRGARPSSGRADAARLPRRSDGCAGMARAAARDRARRGRGRRTRSRRAIAARRRGADRAAVRVPRRRSDRGAAHAGRAQPPLHRRRRRPTTSAGSTRRRSRAFAPKRGRGRATPTRCTKR
jgi:ATP-dependent Lhr-like helicase